MPMPNGIGNMKKNIQAIKNSSMVKLEVGSGILNFGFLIFNVGWLIFVLRLR